MESSEKPRVAVIIPSNLYMAPYVRYYTSIMDRLEISYDIISWNRSGIEEAGVQAFELKESKSRFGRISDYLRYRRFVKVKLAKGNYDKVVIFTIFNTLLLFPFLKAKYRNNYVFDIRDHSVVLKYFRARFTAAIQNAAMVVISSEGFKQWLPKNVSYLIGHNLASAKPLEMLSGIGGQTTTYKILTIGSIRNYEVNRLMVESLASDPAFEMDFVGDGPAVPMLTDFVSDSKIKNVRFQGRYDKQDEHKHLVEVSLMNVLTNEDINSMTLMTNRFYLSLVHGIPMIVNENTEQARWVEKYNLGVVVDQKLNIKEQILRYIEAFDCERFDAGRRACLELVQQDLEEFEAEFKTFLER